MMGYDLNTTEAAAGLGGTNMRDIGAELARLSATVADLTAANSALAAECARLKARDEVLRAIADLTEISGAKFKTIHPELNRILDDAGIDNWGRVISEFAARAYLAGGE